MTEALKAKTVELLLELQQQVGGGYHPDEDASSYIVNTTGESSFIGEDAEWYDAVNDFCRERLGEEVFGLCVPAQERFIKTMQEDMLRGVHIPV
jgi:hypothetical protein